jgi:methionine synthase II (cobalamin-independent)
VGGITGSRRVPEFYEASVRQGANTARLATPLIHYATAEEYLFAIADAMHEEYKAIVDAGFLVQIDDPRLVTYYIKRA